METESEDSSILALTKAEREHYSTHSDSSDIQAGVMDLPPILGNGFFPDYGKSDFSSLAGFEVSEVRNFNGINDFSKLQLQTFSQFPEFRKNSTDA